MAIRRFQRVTVLVLSLLAAGLLAHFAAVRYEISCREITRQTTHSVDLALNRYSSDTSFLEYPKDIRDLIPQYIVRLPINPYTGKPVEILADGEAGSPGNLVYVTASEEIVPGHVAPVSYLLAGYVRQGRGKWPERLWRNYPPNRIDWRSVVTCLSDDELLPPISVQRRALVEEFNSSKGVDGATVP